MSVSDTKRHQTLENRNRKLTRLLADAKLYELSSRPVSAGG
jgi:hypothetical protein